MGNALRPPVFAWHHALPEHLQKVSADARVKATQTDHGLYQLRTLLAAEWPAARQRSLQPSVQRLLPLHHRHRSR